MKMKNLFAVILVIMAALTGCVGKPGNSSGGGAAAGSSSSARADWRKWMAGYRELVQQYTAVLRGRSGGDLSQISKIPENLEKLKRFYKEAAEIRSGLSEPERKEFDRELQKMMEDGK